MAISNPNALSAFMPDTSNPSDFYGSSEHDQVSGTDMFGQQIAIDKDQLE